MARYREAPRCYFCNEVIAKAIYDEKLLNSDFIGDAFERWEYFKHECKVSVCECKKPLHNLIDNNNRCHRCGGVIMLNI